MPKPALTRRVYRLYQDVLLGDASRDLWLNSKAAGSPGHMAQANAWQAFYFAKRWSGRDIDLKRLQGIVLRKGTGECATAFARYIPGANVKRLQNRVISVGTSKELREFARSVPGANVRRMEDLASVMEVMGH